MLADWAAIAIENAGPVSRRGGAPRGARARRARAEGHGGDRPRRRRRDRARSHPRARGQARAGADGGPRRRSSCCATATSSSIAAGAGHVQVGRRGAPAAGRLDRRPGAGRGPQPPHRRRGARAADRRPEKLGVGPCLDGAARPARLPRPEPRRAGRLRSHGRRWGLLARRRAAPRGLRGAGGDRGGHREVGGGRSPPPLHGGGRGRAPPVGARAARRDAAGARGPEGAPVERRAARRSRGDALGHARRDPAAERRHRVAALAHRRAAPARPRPARAGARAHLAGAADGRRQRTSRSMPRWSSETSSGWHPRWRPPSTASSRSRSPTWSSMRERPPSICRCAATGRSSRSAWPTTGSGSTPTGRRPRGFGLTGMRERVELAGGELTVLRRRRRRDHGPRAAAAGLSCRGAELSSRTRTRGRARSGRARRGWSGRASAGCARGGTRRCAPRGRAACADLGVRVAQRDQPQHLDLALGEVVRGARGLRRRGGERSAQPRVEVGAAFGHPAHRVDELVVGGLLEHVSGGARAQRAARELRVLLHREDHDVRIGGDLLHARDGVERARARRAC